MDLARPHATLRDTAGAWLATHLFERLSFPLVAEIGARVEALVPAKLKPDQSTVARRVVCSGIGLHGGDEVEIALCPAAPDTGIVFVVTSQPGATPVEIAARAGALSSASRATHLTSDDGTMLSTVEHLLATLYVMRLDNLRVEVRGAEIPVLDGSALPFIDWVRSAGRVEQSSPRIELDVLRSFEVNDGLRSIRIDPYPVLRITYSIDFDHPSIGRQTIDWPEVEEGFFESDIAGARTFGFEKEIEALRAAGLAIGGSFENALVLDEACVLNESGLRWSDEFVRHKVIDLLGDLALVGARINGHIQVERGGHSLHHRLVKGLLEEVGLLSPAGAPQGTRDVRQTGLAQSLA
jgi:UDP-3-O-[3-hydroxymyristoyl] N-acetylglucosamine deacetylase